MTLVTLPITAPAREGHLQGASRSFQSNWQSVRTKNLDWMVSSKARTNSGWADYQSHCSRLSGGGQLCPSAYLLISLQFWGLGRRRPLYSTKTNWTCLTVSIAIGMSHKAGKTFPANVQYEFQPFICFGNQALIWPCLNFWFWHWLCELIEHINQFPG